MSIDVQQSTAIPTGTWTIDPSHSEVGFTARHLMSKVRGLFESFEGTLVTGDAPSATASIDLNSINTRDENRDAHLRSGDFFDVESTGPMTFTSTKVEQGGRGLLVTGDLTIKGVTNPVTLDVEYLGSETDPWGGTRVGFEGTTEISRKQWGVDFNVPMDGGRLLVGDKVAITVAVQAVLKQDDAS
ncbi:MAG TPA: YceI family protein [Nocardioidaceae bacterium]|jgi:polyisoprenoid-binding protein YceI|nr:YceI family protein [Nocardioidaceae bacterium]